MFFQPDKEESPVKAFSTLTRRGQITRLRRLATSVLSEYDLVDPKLAYLGHGFNTTFCIHAEAGAPVGRRAGYNPHRYLLRVHRPGWHGTQQSTRTMVQSEMLWLSALRQHTNLVVPESLTTKDGAYTSVGRDEGVPEARVCSALRWVNGRFQARSPKPIHLYRVGVLTAQLHNHALAWTRPAGFARHRWDWDALFGDAISFTDLSASDVWEIVPAPYRAVLEEAAIAWQRVLDRWGKDAAVWGLIHADLHLDNVIFAAGEARPIDFDDCGFGYWLYDIAVALWELRLQDDWPAFRQAFLDGYAQHRPLPHDQLPYLDTFIAAREATIGLATAAMTREVPAYREYLDEDMRSVAETIEAIGQKGS